MPDYIQVKDKDVVTKMLPWQRRGLQQTASGYGGKLTSTKMLKHNGRLYRIYIAQYGNAGSAYIIKKGKRLFLRGI